MKILLFLLLLVVTIFSAAIATKKVVCYWGTWAAYRQGNGKYEIDNIDPTLCTHIIYTFLKASSDGSVTYWDPYLDLTDNYGKGYIEKFIALKSKSPSTKFIMSVGGWTAGSGVYSQIAANQNARSNFAKSVLDILNKHGFDGFDFDWEYPNQREGSSSNDKENFISLLKELKSVLGSSGKLLSVAVGSVEPSASKSYDISKVAANVDFVNLMTYDLHGGWDGKTGLNAPLYARSDDNQQLSVDAAVKYWLNNGCPSDKLIVGSPLYGRSFTLVDVNNNGVNAPATTGEAGVFVPEMGFLGYNEICYNIQTKGWTRKWEDTQKGPYAYKDNQWVGYEDDQSLKVKLDYIQSKNLGGVMFWSIETDDFANLCGKGKNPLLTLAKNSMNYEAPKVFAYSGMPFAYYPLLPKTRQKIFEYSARTQEKLPPMTKSFYMGKFGLRFRLKENSRREALRLMQVNFKDETKSNNFLSMNMI